MRGWTILPAAVAGHSQKVRDNGISSSSETAYGTEPRQQPWLWPALLTLCAGTLLLASSLVPAATLRVCSDPNNLPFSNRKQQGFENKIAGLIAKDLHRTLTYTWMPQRRNFFRRTLLAKECDVVMGVPTGFDLVQSTNPYYRSTYAFVTDRSKNLHIASFDDPVLKNLRIGLHAIGSDGANTPPAHALAKRGIVKNIVGFRMWEEGDVQNPPGKAVDAVAKGEIDVAIIWGPFAGYFAKPYKGKLTVTKVSHDTMVTMPFSYDISLGVRKDDGALKNELQAVLDRRHDDVKRILDDYGVPLVSVEAGTHATP